MIGRVAGAPEPFAGRLYGVMLRLLPQHFRRRYGADAGDVFHDMYRCASQTASPARSRQ